MAFSVERVNEIVAAQMIEAHAIWVKHQQDHAKRIQVILDAFRKKCE